MPLERTPAWSQVLTEPLGRAIPMAWRTHVLIGIKALHTAIFASVAACIGVFVWEGIRQRPGRRAATALGVALAETAVFVSNNQVCPLTPLAEELGADDGSVADIFLPEWASRRIPLIGGAALLLGVALHLVAVLGRRGSPLLREPSGFSPGERYAVKRPSNRPNAHQVSLMRANARRTVRILTR